MSYIVLLPLILVFGALAALFLHLGTAVAGIDGRGYGKALTATVIDMVASLILGGALGLIGLREGFVPAAIGLALNLFIIKSVFATSWGRALLAWLVQIVATVVVVVVPLAFFFGAALLAR